MFLMKKIIAKLKNFIKGRAVFKLWLFCACFLIVVWYIWNWSEDTDPDAMPRHLCKYIRYPEGYTIPKFARSDRELEELIRIIDKLNLNPVVRNSHEHGSIMANTTVIAVQARGDAERLQHLIVSLAQVNLIEHALLIFSHSYYDEGLNELIRSINFCKVMQIYYPYSLQLYPENFPGMDPGDGFNRDARRSELKQHWWWTAHFVFNLKTTSPQCLVIFLEETDYVLPDLLHMLRYLRRMQMFFPYAEVVALGKPHAEGLDYDAILLDWWSPKYDRGLAFNSSMWARIAANASYFCKYKDCGWSHSLAHVFSTFDKGAVDVVTCLAPRVVGTGRFASGGAAARWARGVARRARLFPGSLRAVVMAVAAGGRVRHVAPPRAPGGCPDRRDHQLCLDIGKSNISESIFSHSIIY